jgi:amino acid transporter
MPEKPSQELTLFDSTSLIVGIIIGVGIYQMAPDIAKGAGGPWGVLGIWLLGGIISLFGALSYAELATTYPQAGGDYVYLSRAYGRWAGFLFGWAQLAIVRPGDIAVLAFAFATYARAIYDPLAGSAFPFMQQVYAVAAVAVLTLINILGVRQGKWTQNLLTSVKALGLLFIVGVAFFARPSAAAAEPGGALPYNLALIFVLFAYGGWNEMAYVAAEVRNPRRNIVRTLVLGTLAVTALYVLINAAFLSALGYEGVKASKAIGADVVSGAFPQFGGILISLLVCVSALGAVNGTIFTGARISYAMGSDYQMFRALGEWHPRLRTPATALSVQGIIAAILLIVLGSYVNAVLYTAAVVYSFYLASTLAILVLRRKEPAVDRPCRVPLYPVLPLVFAGACAFLIYSAVTYRPVIAAAAAGLILLGAVLYRLFGINR